MTNKVLVFGEVLVDKINGKFHPGGAPFNVACHLKGFGLEPDFISAIGMDDVGKLLTEYIDRKQLKKEHIQINDWPTGVVEVEIIDNEPSFTILEDRSWDYIEYDRNLNPDNYDLLYYGTLASRSNMNLETLIKIKKKFSKTIFVDLNIRDPFFNLKRVEELITNIDYLKVNKEELNRIESGDDINTQIRTLSKRYRIKKIICTMGDKGVIYFDGRDITNWKIIPVKNFKDAVGAGDSFSAYFISSLLQHNKEDIEGGCSFASKICTLNGALPEDSGFYRS